MMSALIQIPIKLVLLSTLFISNVFAAGCNVDTFSSLTPPGDATNIIIDTATNVPPNGLLPGYCNVKGRLDTNSTSVINFDVILPTPWNNKFYMAGNGGFAGSIPALSPFDLEALAFKYVIARTDTGHVGTGNPTWALNNNLGLINYGYRATHLTALISKEIIMSYYSAPPKYSYFLSCSNGGRQGLMEAQRYPTDFDGIIAGDPAYDITGLTLKTIQMMQSQYPNEDFLNPTFPLSKLNLLTTTVLNKCDAVDGITDGLINDPSKCKFKAKKDLPACVNDIDGTDCFTTNQIDTLNVIYDTLKTAGHQLYPGFIPGAEREAGPFSWTNYIFGTPTLIIPANGTTAHPNGVPSRLLQIAEGSIDNFVTFTNLQQPVSYLDFDLNDKQDVADWLTVSQILNATNPDLTAFKNNNGKLIIYHGWNDPAISPLSTIDYYKNITTKMNGLKKTQDFSRLFMVPGMLHCATGPGAWRLLNLIPTLENWVEQDIAPDFIIGVNPTTNMTRPACPYPKIAVLNEGLEATDPIVTNNAANFHCEKHDN